VFPSQTTITNGSYPLSRPLLLYVARHNLEREEVRGFLRGSVEEAQRLASAARLVPVPETVLQRNLDVIEDGDVDGTPEAGVPGGTATTPGTEDVPGVARGTTTPTTPTTSTPTTPTTTVP
jgi:hypothetical protein